MDNQIIIPLNMGLNDITKLLKNIQSDEIYCKVVVVQYIKQNIKPKGVYYMRQAFEFESKEDAVTAKMKYF